MCLAHVAQDIDESVNRRDFLKLGGTLAAASLFGAGAGEAEAQPAPPKRPSKTLRYDHVVGLSHVLSPETPIWPGFEPIKITPVKQHDKDGFYLNQWTLHEHHGTHLDAPIHFAKGKWGTDDLPDDTLICPAAVIDVRDRARGKPDAEVTPDDLKRWERRHGRIPQGAAVLMLSGWEARIGDQSAYRNQDDKGVLHFPGFHKEAVEWLLKERQINGIGVDTLSLDHGASQDFAVHYLLLPANKWGIENLAQLAKIPPSGATLFVGVPKVKGASGGPTRVIAVW
jgi:kynurenine formamidase